MTKFVFSCFMPAQYPPFSQDRRHMSLKEVALRKKLRDLETSLQGMRDSTLQATWKDLKAKVLLFAADPFSDGATSEAHKECLEAARCFQMLIKNLDRTFRANVPTQVNLIANRAAIGRPQSIAANELREALNYLELQPASSPAPVSSSLPTGILSVVPDAKSALGPLHADPQLGSVFCYAFSFVGTSGVIT